MSFALGDSAIVHDLYCNRIFVKDQYSGPAGEEGDPQIAQNTSDIALLNNEVASLDTRVTALEDAPSGGGGGGDSAQVTQNTDAITVLQGQTSSNASAISLNSGLISSNTQATQNNQSAITQLQSDVSAASASAASNAGDIVALTTRVSANESDISTLDSKVTQNLNTNTTNTAQIGTNTGNIASNLALIQGLDTRVTTNEGSAAANSTATQANSTAITNLSGRVDTLESAGPPAGVFTVEGTSGQDAALQLNCEMNSHGVKIQAPPHSAAADYTLVLPESVGTSGQVLSTDGSGNLAWADQASGGGGGVGGLDLTIGVEAVAGKGYDGSDMYSTVYRSTPTSSTLLAFDALPGQPQKVDILQISKVLMGALTYAVTFSDAGLTINPVPTTEVTWQLFYTKATPEVPLPSTIMIPPYLSSATAYGTSADIVSTTSEGYTITWSSHYSSQTGLCAFDAAGSAGSYTWTSNPGTYDQNTGAYKSSKQLAANTPKGEYIVLEFPSKQIVTNIQAFGAYFKTGVIYAFLEGSWTELGSPEINGQYFELDPIETSKVAVVVQTLQPYQNRCQITRFLMNQVKTSAIPPYPLSTTDLTYTVTASSTDTSSINRSAVLAFQSTTNFSWGSIAVYASGSGSYTGSTQLDPALPSGEWLRIDFPQTELFNVFTKAAFASAVLAVLTDSGWTEVSQLIPFADPSQFGTICMQSFTPVTCTSAAIIVTSSLYNTRVFISNVLYNLPPNPGIPAYPADGTYTASQSSTSGIYITDFAIPPYSYAKTDSSGNSPIGGISGGWYKMEWNEITELSNMYLALGQTINEDMDVNILYSDDDTNWTLSPSSYTQTATQTCMPPAKIVVFDPPISCKYIAVSIDELIPLCRWFFNCTVPVDEVMNY